MKTSTKLYSLIFALTSLFLISVSFAASAVTAQNIPPRINEIPINSNDTAKTLISGTEEMSGNPEITVYNSNTALIKEKIKVNLTNGTNILNYKYVTSQIDPTSVLVKDPTNNKTVLLEQQYEYDLVSNSNLLDKYLEKIITITDSAGKNYTGKLLSYHGKQAFLEIDDKGVVVLNIATIKLPDASGLFTKPTLVWHIYSPTSGNRDILVSYLTGGLSWSANYILQTNANSTKADIQSWVSISNNAGITFNDAKLKLMSGDTHRVYSARPMYSHRSIGAEVGPLSAKGISEAPIFEYHLYTLEKPVTLMNSQTKQISFLSADAVPLQKELLFDSSKGNNARVVLNIDNSKAGGLGISLPRGTVRVYQLDSESQLQFIGEDQIDNIPIGEKIKVTLGNVFDIIAKRIQTDFEQVNNNVSRTSYEIELNNSKSDAQNVTVVEHCYGNWKIIKNSDSYKKIDAFTVEFRVSVPAKDTKTISYTVENAIGAFV